MISLFTLLAVLLFLFLISLSVFGGGQIFMSIFQWFWQNLDKWFNIKIDQSQIQNIFSIANLTPGILSPKFAMVSGFYAANGQWWGWITMLLAYSVFVIPAILIMHLASKRIQKSENQFLKKLINFIKPIIIGIVFALAIQLFISILLPYFSFNHSYKQYLKKDNLSNISLFFKDWRLVNLYIFVPIMTINSFYFSYKKYPFLFIFYLNILISLLAFQPWL